MKIHTPRNILMKKNKFGFTLVELIVVITILVILGTIAFMSLQGFSGSARDSSRVSDLTNLSKGLDIAYIKTSSYPMPDNSFSVTYSGGVIWYQGTIGEGVMNIISAAGAKMNKKPMDPLSTTKEYTYSKLFYGNAYQIKTDWEGDSVAYNQTPFSIPEVQAASGNPTITYIKGNYNGMVAKTQTGSTIYYLLAVPSLFLNTGSGIVVLSSTTATGFYIHGQTNSGGILFTGSIVYSSGALPGNDTEKALFATNLANVYSGTSLANNSNIASFINALGNTGTLAALGGGLLSSSLGGSASTGYIPPVTPTYSCIGSIVTANANISNTTGLSVNTAYQTTTSGNSCYFTCKVNYSGANCEIYTAPVPDWTAIDTNCIGKPNVTIGGQVWAGCNSTIGSTAIAYGQTSCYNYAGGSMTCTAPPGGKTVSTMTEADYLAGQSNNIYGALYQWDTMNANTCFGTGISASNTSCPCKGGYHLPTQAEWDTLETTLGCSGAEKLTGDATGWECLVSNTADTTNGLGWTSTNPNSLKNKLGLSLAGYCSSVGSCTVRGYDAYYWSSSVYAPLPFVSWRRTLNYSNASVFRNNSGPSNYSSVRCLKD